MNSRGTAYGALWGRRGVLWVGRALSRGGILFDYRQLDREFGAAGRLILDAESAAVVPHYAVANAQPQPSALAYILCREEGIEELGDVLFRYSGTVVAHYEPQHIVAALGDHSQIVTDSSLLHRLFRVDHEVEHDLLDLVWIGHGHEEAGLEVGLEPDVVYHKAIFAQIEYRLDGLVDCSVDLFVTSAASEREQILDDADGPLCLAADGVDSLLGGWIEVLFGSEELGVVPDAGQRIVELVLQWRR